jgi:bifunctional ADP-heptose synthase (sugar kinase/adenylyltransferase)
MTDGSFDPLHEGHIAYFEAAARLGLPVLCNIAPDSWTLGKHPVLLAQSRRASVIDAIRYISYVHCSTSTTQSVLERLRPVTYVKGRDWLDRGGIPSDEQALCERCGIQVVYLDTVKNSSSRLIHELRRA